MRFGNFDLPTFSHYCYRSVLFFNVCVCVVQLLVSGNSLNVPTRFRALLQKLKTVEISMTEVVKRAHVCVEKSKTNFTTRRVRSNHRGELARKRHRNAETKVWHETSYDFRTSVARKTAAAAKSSLYILFFRIRDFTIYDNKTSDSVLFLRWFFFFPRSIAGKLLQY